MTKLGEARQWTWPEHPVEKPQEGDTVRYPQAGTSRIVQGKIAVVAEETVLFEDGNWAYRWELNEDRD
jgi:hypothetical protein